MLIGERLHVEKPMSLSPWIIGLVVFGGEDPETMVGYDSLRCEPLVQRVRGVGGMKLMTSDNNDDDRIARGAEK